MHNYIAELNPIQQEAVKSIKGPNLIIAGAGSGKTRVLTYRIAFLLENGIPAKSILALTFTNKAAKEMKERIASVVGQSTSRNLWMGTFHSIFAKILRNEAKLLGYTSNFTIYDTTDTKSILKNIVKEMNLDDKTYKPSDVYGRISMAKNNLITAAAYPANAQLMEFDKSSRKPEIATIYKHYTQRCFKADAMDFDDLLLNTNILFRDFPEVLAKYQSIFSHILVDEYQDTNFSQYLIVKKLATNHQNLCVVGDDSQSIYSFRGAKIENILNFRNDYPNYKSFKLEQNYRSTQTIVDAANSIIAKNKFQIPKTVFSKNEVGNKIKVHNAITDTEEGFIVANEIIDSRLTNQLNFSDFAILYRTNAQSRIFEEALRKRNIPYKIYGGISFYQRKEIKDLIAYFRLVINPKDEEAFRRVINYPTRGIGDTTISRLFEFAQQENFDIWTILENINTINIGINKGISQKIHQFFTFIKALSAKLYTCNAFDLASEITLTSGITHELHNDKSPESVSKYENIEALLNGIQEFTTDTEEEIGQMITLDMYLENISLLTDADNEKPEDRDKVTLMTIHSAKGLEFNSVFIVGVEEELFPSKYSSTTAQELEEERRLFYVALTRAKKEAAISYCRSRYKWGSLESCSPSRFIKDIDSEYLDMPKEASIFTEENFETSRNQYFKKPTIQASQEATYQPTLRGKNLMNINNAIHKKVEATEITDITLIQVDMQVEHERFGFGTIIQVEGEYPNTKATIVFKNSGQKQLLLKFAKLRIIN